MANKELKGIEVANNLEKCHPALDFLKERSVITVKEKSILIYEVEKNGKTKEERKMTDTNFCVVNNGEINTFWLRELTELARYNLFYAGKLDIDGNRWNYDDIMDFKKTPICMSFKDVYKLIWDKYEYYYEFMDDKMYWLLTTFTMYTYFYPMFNHAPILHFFGEFRTGKTKLCQLIEAMAFNPINSSNISAATIFRAIQGRRAIVILDESEDVTSKTHSEITNMLLGGVNKSGKAYRQEKGKDDSFNTQSYEVFSPKIIANISGVDLSSLNSRIIRVSTASTTNVEKKNRDVDLENPDWQHIRNQLYRLTMIGYKEILEIKKTIQIEGLSGRWYNIWFGMLCVARACSERLFYNVLEVAKTLSNEMEATLETETPSTMVLEHLFELVKNTGTEMFTTSELFNTFTIDERIDMKFQTIQGLGSLLSRIGLASKVARNNGKVERQYTIPLAWIEERIKRK